MATRRFCDLCDEPIQPEDDQPFIRVYVPTHSGIRAVPKAVGHIMIMNEQNHVLTDVCNGCKLKVVNDGASQTLPAVATLQQQPSSTVPAALPTPVLPFTPSIPPAPASRGEEL
jgi:hypothetical protein